MNTNDDNIELIDRYLEDKLTEEELTDFKQQLSDDADFRETVEAQRLAIAQIQHQAALKKMRQFGQELKAETPVHTLKPKIRRLPPLLKIAVAIALLLVAGLVIVIPIINNNNEIAEQPTDTIDNDKYGTDSKLDFNESLKVKQLQLTDDIASTISGDRTIRLSILFEQISQATYDFQTINNDLFLLINKETLDAENLTPVFIQIFDKDSSRLYLRLDEKFYQINEGEQRPLVVETDETILNVLEKQ